MRNQLCGGLFGFFVAAAFGGTLDNAWSNEPKPNGRRINLGAYGNTPWATRSPGGGALIVR